MTGGWRLAARNLRRNMRRNVATGVAIALGFAGLSILGGYITRVELFLRTNAVYLQHGGHVAIFRTGGLERAAARPARYALDAGLQHRIAEALDTDPRVAFAARYLRGMGLAGNGCRTVPFVALGIEPGTAERVVAHPDVGYISADFVRPLRGRPLHEVHGVPGAVGLSAGLSRLLGKTRTHDEFGPDLPAVVVPDCAAPDLAAQVAADANVQLAALTFDGALSAIDGEVVNVFHTPSADTEDQTVHTDLETLQRLYATDAVTYVAAFLHEARDAGPLARDLRARFAAAGLPLDVFTYDDERLNPYYVGSMGFLVSMVIFILLLVASVVALGVMNTSTLTVLERGREIGTFRALGYTRRHVTGLLVREMTLLAALGAGLGLAIATAVSAAVALADIRVTPPGVPGSLRLLLTPGPRVYAAVASLILPLAIAVTWAVARRSARRGTADLLTATRG